MRGCLGCKRSCFTMLRSCYGRNMPYYRLFYLPYRKVIACGLGFCIFSKGFTISRVVAGYAKLILHKDPLLPSTQVILFVTPGFSHFLIVCMELALLTATPHCSLPIPPTLSRLLYFLPSPALTQYIFLTNFIPLLQLMATKEQLMARLRQFSEKVRIFRGQVGRAEEEQMRGLIVTNEELIAAIQRLFKSMYASRADNFGIDKLQKEFEKLLKQYQEALRKYQDQEKKQVGSLRKTLTNIHKEIRKSRMRQSSFGQAVGKIQMHQVNQETLHYERMIELKENEIRTIKDRMHDALKVQEDMKNLVYEQGGKLDEVEENIDSANRNVREGHDNLIEAKKEHMSAKKKKICIIVIVVVVILAILIPILIKFT